MADYGFNKKMFWHETLVQILFAAMHLTSNYFPKQKMAVLKSVISGKKCTPF